MAQNHFFEPSIWLTNSVGLDSPVNCIYRKYCTRTCLINEFRCLLFNNPGPDVIICEECWFICNSIENRPASAGSRSAFEEMRRRQALIREQRDKLRQVKQEERANLLRSRNPAASAAASLGATCSHLLFILVLYCPVLYSSTVLLSHTM